MAQNSNNYTFEFCATTIKVFWWKIYKFFSRLFTPLRFRCMAIAWMAPEVVMSYFQQGLSVAPLTRMILLQRVMTYFNIVVLRTLLHNLVHVSKYSAKGLSTGCCSSTSAAMVTAKATPATPVEALLQSLLQLRLCVGDGCVGECSRGCVGDYSWGWICKIAIFLLSSSLKHFVRSTFVKKWSGVRWLLTKFDYSQLDPPICEWSGSNGRLIVPLYSVNIVCTC